MADQKTQYVVTHDSGPSPPSSALLSPRTKVEQGMFRIRQSAHRFWMLEAVASVLSMLMFMAIIIILIFEDNRIYGDATTVQGDKERRPIVFSVLAFMSAVMRATMLLPVATAIGQLKWSWFRSPRRLIDMERFDEATRGILGSAKLFFYLRFRNLAAIGAALTILALPLDALIQSSIRMPSKQMSVNRLKEISSEFGRYMNETFMERATSYTRYQTYTDETVLWPDTAMVNAIQYGLGFSNGIGDFANVETIVVCPTGYCNFTKMQTLAIGQRCMIRDDVTYVPERNNVAAYQTLPGTDLRLYVESTARTTKQSIVAATYPQYPLTKPLVALPADHEPDELAQITWPLIARTSMLFNRASLGTEKARNYTYGIDCVLFWHVRTTQMYINDASNFTLNSTEDVDVRTKAEIDESGRVVLRPQTCYVDGKQVAGQNESSYDDTFWRNNCIFWVGYEPHVGMQTMLKDQQFGLMANQTLLEWHNDTNSAVWNRRNTFTMNLNKASSYASGNSTMQTAQETFQQISIMWRNIAYFSSFTVRGSESIQVDGTANLNVTGTVYALVTYYSVDWWRLTMPAFIIVCCALFVLYTAILTRKEYAWRRSALPLLFHGLEDQERFAQGDVRDFNAMQDAAKEIRVRLTEHVDENGARLTTQN